MKYFYKLTSNLTFSFALLCVSAQETITSSDNYLQKSFERSVQEISSEKEIRSELHFRGLNQESLRAPNSYIYDLELAKTNNFAGLKIPVTKAFAIWENADWYLNQPLNTSRTLSTYVYWEDVPGLIQSVELENAPEKENSKIIVKVNPKKGMGNALVSLHLGNNGNSDDPIVWSWHIWVTDDPSNGVSYGQDIETDKNGNLFTPKYMDRNLGAVHNDILGHNWHKTSGLMYQWGRKDPIPPMVYKDFSFYEITGLVGVIRNREDGSRGNKLPEYMRPFENISHNLRLSVKNPLAYLLNSDAGTWFSSQQYRVPNSNPANVMTWDLWSDNYRGGNSNAGSSNAAVKSDSRSYELKSPYDPCPNGWRIPSYLGRVTVNNNLSPWGRKNSGANDDTSPPTNMFYHNAPNNFILNAKVHSGLGVDFTETHTSSNVTRDIGKIPMTGYYVLYPNNGNPTVVFQDENAIAAFWTATYSLGGARYMRVVTDPLRPDLSIFGLNQILINQTSQSQEAMAVRCMEDPNLSLSGDFQTEYIPASKTYFTDGLTNPNSYIINGETELLIPVNKAFSAYEQLFPEKNALPDNDLIAHVYWADNPQLVQTVKIIESGGDAKNDFIRVQLNAGQRGNAVISLHNESITNPVYWSWHLWAVADEIQEITYVNQEILATTHNFINTTGTENPVLTTTFMDRNLGAVHDLPMEILSNPNSPELKNEVKLSGGLHYQWGRKDPIPSFRLVGGDPYEIYYGRMVNDQGIVTYSTLNQLTYLNLFTKIYSNYRSESAIEPGDNKYQEADKIIQYSVRNPLTFMHKGTTISTDWVSSNLAVHSNRWGHGEGKSIYDPCPAGWRVPDTFKAHQSGKGSSPWFNGKKLGSLQGSAHLMEIHYDGQFAQSDGKPAGWFFTDPDYQIGNFPTTGIIGKFSPNSIGGTDNAQAITGVWTASLTQQLKGHALAMSIGKLTDSSHRVISTGNVSPSHGLNVRCAKDEIRYDGNVGVDYFNLEKREFTQSVLDETIQFYPNPVADYLNTSSSENLEIEIFDRYGKLVLKSKFQNQKVDIRSLEKGIYIGLINAPDTSEILTIKIFKR